LRVLLVSANYRPSVGGIERFTELLAEGLVARGHAVRVLCCRSGNAPLREHGAVEVVRLRATSVVKRMWNVPYPLPSPPALMYQLRGLARWADVMHVQDALYATSAPALTASRVAGKPSVLTQHVAFVPQHARWLDTLEGAAIATVGQCARLATRVVSYNEDVAAWAEATWGLARVAVLPAGVAEPRTDAAKQQLRAEFGLPAGRFVALFVGRDVPKKRLGVFLAAADPAYELVAVTDARVAPSDGVRLLQLMPHDRLQRLLLACDAFVLPSHAEGFPLALQEALLAGVPCIVPRVPGYSRHLREDEVVWIEPTPYAVRGALRELVDDGGLTAALCVRAKTAGRREFGLDRFVDVYEELYTEVRAGTRPEAV
jgi:glycosyltransferase involved in cell wall biosynthesis